MPTPLQVGGRCLTNQLAASHAHLLSPADPQDSLSLSTPSGPETRTRSSSCPGCERVPCGSRGLPRDRPEVRSRGTRGSKLKAELQNIRSFMSRGQRETHTQPAPAGRPRLPPWPRAPAAREPADLRGLARAHRSCNRWRRGWRTLSGSLVAGLAPRLLSPSQRGP